MNRTELTESESKKSRASSFLASVVLLVGFSITGPMAAYAAEVGVCSDDLEIEYQDDPDAIEYGRERFGQRCVFCHGSGGLGAKGPALVKGKFKRGGCNQDIVGNIASGIPGTQMGAFGRSLEFDEILKIVAYLRDEERKYREAGEVK